MKKILLIGNHEHQFITNLVKWLKKDNDNFVIDIFSTHNLSNDGYTVYRKIYKSYSLNSFIQKLPLIRKYYNQWQYTSNFKQIKEHYDIIHIHYVDAFASCLINEIKKKGKKLILSFWGSDFYRANEKIRKKLKNLVIIADAITFTNPKMKNDFFEYYGNMNTSVEIVRFGLEPLEFLKKLKAAKSESRRILGFPDDHIIVTIGYNSSPAQQHIEIIESIKEVTNKLPGNVFFVFPLTYGPKGKHIEELKTILKNSGLKHKLLLEYMPDEKVAHLRNAGDIMIQLQTTDQFSGSMQEHMFTSNVVITGSWLPYDVLEENGVYFRKINKVQEVGSDLLYCVNNLEAEQSKTKSNKEIIYSLSSWPVNINSWVKLYN